MFIITQMIPLERHTLEGEVADILQKERPTAF